MTALDRITAHGARIAWTLAALLTFTIVIGLWKAAGWDVVWLAILLVVASEVVLWWCYVSVHDRLDEHTDRHDQQQGDAIGVEEANEGAGQRPEETASYYLGEPPVRSNADEPRSSEQPVAAKPKPLRTANGRFAKAEAEPADTDEIPAQPATVPAQAVITPEAIADNAWLERHMTEWQATVNRQLAEWRTETGK